MEDNEIYFYSAKNNAFYPESLKEDYLAAGSWPEDAVMVEQSVYDEFAANRYPEDKIRIAGEDGFPRWDNAPAPTEEQLIDGAENKRNKLMKAANAAIAPLQDAVELGIATDEEIVLLKEWKKYRVLLNRVDTSLAPEISWPDLPG
ncbi:tail fiber assembly protein [Escherichia albertii]|uniref:tail fiber assembly protein n=1 Tax=Escherichia albertii TaxID=208962 RepID=UPI000BF6DC7B|nr:tail fiber assembly protein [Escherichia albertii]PFF93581.1 phage tail protein [Escherichia albertii]WDB52784.1 tail fiber assembly protein [Escherichia albertii]